MKVLFGYQDVLEVIKNVVGALVKGATEAQQDAHREEKKKDFKAHRNINSQQKSKCQDIVSDISSQQPNPE